MQNSFNVKVLWDLAPKFDQHLHQSAVVALKPWHQEIRDYVITARKPSRFAQNNLAAWARRKGLLE